MAPAIAVTMIDNVKSMAVIIIANGLQHGVNVLIDGIVFNEENV